MACAYFLAPPGPLLGYDWDGPASGSVWRMQIPVDQRREILLSGGMNLEVASNNRDVVPNDGFGENVCRSDGLRSLWPFGRTPGISMLEARCGCSLACFLQIQVGVGADDDSAAGLDEACQIVLSPVQFAAVLEGANLSEPETTSNRLWGGLTVLGGALELVGAAALLLAPEPTMVTKVAGGALGVHGVDTVATGIDQIISGRPQTTLTAQAAEAAARSMGVDPDGAVKVGMAVDIAVPLVAGFAGAARIIAVRRGVISLAAEEAAGGHTIARHVGRTEAQLLARLATEIKISSGFDV